MASVIIHFVYSTKNRHPFLRPEFDDELYAYQATVFHAMKSPPVLVNGTADHVHALFRLGRTVALCDVVQEVKKRSSKWLKTRHPDLAAFDWQDGYGAFSLGESSLTAATAYVARQKEHHASVSYQDEVRDLLRRYRISFDERYVWD